MPPNALAMHTRRSAARSKLRTNKPRAYRWEEARSIPVREVATRLGLTIKGTSTLCPVHGDSEPSLTFYPKTNSWFCYGCNKGGGTIELVAAIRHTDKTQALKWLLGENAFTDHSAPSPSTSLVLHPDPLPKAEANRDILSWLLRQNPLGPVGTRYLISIRGVSELTIKRFSMGEVQDAGAVLKAARLRWSLKELSACGLITQKYGAPRLIFPNNTILFPFLEDGEIRYVQGRRANDQDEPRWLNLVGISKPLYNVDAIKEHVRSRTIYLCEGVTDTIAASQLGLSAVGVLGAQSLTPDDAKRFSGMTVTLLPDGDQGGIRFERHAVPLLRRANAKVNVSRVPLKTDVADQIRPERTK